MPLRVFAPSHWQCVCWELQAVNDAHRFSKRKKSLLWRKIKGDFRVYFSKLNLKADLIILYSKILTIEALKWFIGFLFRCKILNLSVTPFKSFLKFNFLKWISTFLWGNSNFDYFEILTPFFENEIINSSNFLYYCAWLIPDLRILLFSFAFILESYLLLA